TIQGQGATLRRDTGISPPFRLLDIEMSSHVLLVGLTLTGGLAQGDSYVARGGAVYSQGALTLSGVTVTGNRAQGNDASTLTGDVGATAYGGGIYSGSGALVLTDATRVTDNRAVGGMNAVGGKDGGNAFGGGVYAGGSLDVSAATVISGNVAAGGRGRDG